LKYFSGHDRGNFARFPGRRSTLWRWRQLKNEAGLFPRCRFEVSVTIPMCSSYISVIITTYNYGRFIENAIDSVLSQDFPMDKLEIVVADDGSTDDTAQRVRKYGSKVAYFYQPNGGQASALNLGFAKARGEIIVLLDGDDFFLPAKLSRVADAFQRNPSLGMVYHPMMGWNVQTNERQISRFPLTSGSPFDDIGKFWGYSGPGTCASYRRRFLDRVLPIPNEIRMLADAYTGALIVFVAPVLALPECLSVYRVHGKNSYQVDESRMTVETRKSRLELTQTVVNAMNRWLANQGYFRKLVFARCFRDYWSLYLDRERFLIKPPGRLRFFWFTVKENKGYSPMLSWKFAAINYLACPLALIFGYNKIQSMSLWRRRMTVAAVWLYKMLSGPHVGGSTRRGEG
jgi:glycosyltransferase involved in cell wall biosynthesis